MVVEVIRGFVFCKFYKLDDSFVEYMVRIFGDFERFGF